MADDFPARVPGGGPPAPGHPPGAGTRRAWILGTAVALWVAGGGYGIYALHRYETTPGVAGASPPSWPQGSRLSPDARRASLLMLVHPQCSCTQASLAELASVMRAAGGRLSARVLFVRPRGMPVDWEHSDTWREAQRIAGVTAVTDVDGAEARRFGAWTSGQVVVYDRWGHLLYSGGITDSRGHQGDNMGRRQLLAALDHQPVVSGTAAVYGCPIFDADGPRGATTATPSPAQGPTP